MNRIRDLREDRDLRQVDVSEAIGIDQRTLSNYETGKTNPDSFAIIKLADFFGVSADYLIGRTNESKITADDIIKKIGRIRLALDDIEKDIKNIK
ncbi:MAG: helix-turn-helix transcriptional regulator [Clostridia bacterium]|nr:helix-turn-helix transcriptional regulator [Clostridia bacterium]